MAENTWSRIFKTGLRNMMLAGIVLLVLAFTAGTGMATGDAQTTSTSASTFTGTANAGTAVAGEEKPFEDIEDYDGSIGPKSAMYELKLAIERLDVTFTPGEGKKIGKKMAYARQRVAEAKAEFRKNDDEAATKALEKYREQIKEAKEAISEASDEDNGLLNAQEMMANHEAILASLLESHPTNRGLARAYDNSLELKEEFESKTGKEFVLAARNGRKVLRQMEIDDTKEKLKIKAKIIDNATQIEVDVKFASYSTDNFTIAQEIINRLQLSEENINSIIKIEEEDDEDEYKLKEELEAKAEVKGTISKVEAEYKFPLDETNESDIVKGVHQKLSALTQADILKVLEMKVKKEDKEREKKEEKREKEETLKIKAKITDNATRVKVELKFESGSTDNFTIAREIINRLQLSEENINSIIKIEKEDEEQSRVKEKLEAKAEVKGTISKVEAEYEFPLDETDESRIAGEVHQKLSSLTQADILNVLEMKVKKEKIEIKETGRIAEKTVKEEREEIQNKIEKRTENEIEDREETTQTEERD